MKKYLSIILILLIITGCNKNKKVEDVKYDVTYNVSENETIIIEEKPEGIVSINKEIDKSKCFYLHREYQFEDDHISRFLSFRHPYLFQRTSSKDFHNG